MASTRMKISTNIVTEIIKVTCNETLKVRGKIHFNLVTLKSYETVAYAVDFISEITSKSN